MLTNTYYKNILESKDQFFHNNRPIIQNFAINSSLALTALLAEIDTEILIEVNRRRSLFQKLAIEMKLKTCFVSNFSLVK